MKDPEDVVVPGRRKVLKYVGLSSAGAALIGATVVVGKEKIVRSESEAKPEIEGLRKTLGELDKRSRLILRIVLIASGLDIFL
jgi:uncharacterized protein with PhoU and TrkA domain